MQSGNVSFVLRMQPLPLQLQLHVQMPMATLALLVPLIRPLWRPPMATWGWTCTLHLCLLLPHQALLEALPMIRMCWCWMSLGKSLQQPLRVLLVT